ncbi:MAG: HDOD domain-containing protein [Candidatus Binatia bacterium]
MPKERLRTLLAGLAERCDLPSLPAVATRAMALARDPEASVEDMAKVVATDGPLAARVLRISGSVVYAQRQPPRSLLEAVRRLGFQTLRKILIAASCRQAYRVEDPVGEQLWVHALATALAADELAVLDGEPRGGLSFVAGLLHDMGRLVFHVADPSVYARIAQFDEAAERASFGLTHAEVGGALAFHWGLEDELAEAILQHHGNQPPPLAVRLMVADRIAHATGYPSGAGEAEPVATLSTESDDLLAVSEHLAGVFDRERALFD